jgi:hypothetical protein
MFGVAGWVVLAGGAQAADGRDLSLTIYNSNLALVEDVRAMPIPAGRQRLEFKDVSAQIRPETVSLSAPNIAIVEQNFDFDLLTPAKLMEKAVGHQVQIVRTNPGTGAEVRETATVLSANAGVVLRIGDRIEVLRDDGVPTRVIFDSIPENLRARPTLSVTVQSGATGTRDARLSYLTTGLSWKADYVALFDEAAGRLDLQGWVTLTNQSGVAYPDAEIQLVAGDVNLTSGPVNWDHWRQQQAQRRNVRAGGREMGAERPIGDYYIYPMPARSTVAENQTKQISFLDVKGAAARKAYEYTVVGFESSDVAQSVDSALQFTNSSSGGLGAQLPAGVLRAYIRDDSGDPKFVGENAIGHTPRGSDISVKLGDAFDLTVQPTLLKAETISPYRRRYEMSYVLRNASSRTVTVRLRQSADWSRAKMQITRESLESVRVDTNTVDWNVPVPAGGETTLTFTAVVGDR